MSMWPPLGLESPPSSTSPKQKDSPSLSSMNYLSSWFMLDFWLVWFCVGKHSAVIWCAIEMLFRVLRSLYVLALFHLFIMNIPELSVGRLIYDPPTTECFELFILGTQTRYEFLHQLLPITKDTSLAKTERNTSICYQEMFRRQFDIMSVYQSQKQ